MFSPMAPQRGQTPLFGMPRRASLSEVQQRSWIASHPKNLYLSGAKEDQTSLAAGRAVRPAKQARYVSRVE
jgi:hypothetical protein